MSAYNKTIYKNPAQTYLSSLNSATSKSNCKRVIKRFCLKQSDNPCFLSFEWSLLNYTLIVELKAYYQSLNLKPSTINVYISTIKGVAKECWKQGIISTDNYLYIKSVKLIKHYTSAAGKALTSNELREIVFQCEKCGTLKGKRNAAMIALSYGAGLRVHELAKLTLDNYKNGELKFTGKGNKEAIQPLPKFVIKKLDRWLSYLPSGVNALFLRIWRNDCVSSYQLSHRSINKIYKRIGCVGFSSHDLRRSYATNLLESGVDLFVVRDLMRHENINTTKRYDMRGEKTKKVAVELLPF